MIPMKCTKDLVYAGKRMKAGTEFMARGEGDARLLVAIKKAERVTVYVGMDYAAGVDKTVYSTRAMTAEVPQLPSQWITVDGAMVALDDMDTDELRALTEKRGIKVHHLAGAKKLREALIKSQEVTE